MTSRKMFKHYLNATLSYFLQFLLGFKSEINKTRSKKIPFLKKIHQITNQRAHSWFFYSVLRIVFTLIAENTWTWLTKTNLCANVILPSLQCGILRSQTNATLKNVPNTCRGGLVPFSESRLHPLPGDLGLAVRVKQVIFWIGETGFTSKLKIVNTIQCVHLWAHVWDVWGRDHPTCYPIYSSWH